uniref:Uncharacterized protein n=1 Tax=Arundo donax TaxID=35708 RepID=A0A0A9AQA5_ARUDO
MIFFDYEQCTRQHLYKAMTAAVYGYESPQTPDQY